MATCGLATEAMLPDDVAPAVAVSLINTSRIFIMFVFIVEIHHIMYMRQLLPASPAISAWSPKSQLFREGDMEIPR